MRKSKPTEIVLGNRYRDKVSGWEGVAIARYEYLNGCTRIELGHHDKDGKPESFVFDHEQIEAVDAAAVTVPLRRTGGPQTNAPMVR